MIKMNEEVYLQNLVFKKTHDDKGCVMGTITFKNSISLEEYTNIQEKKDLILCDKLQNNWNELKRWVKEYEQNSYGLGSYETGITDGLGDVLKKMQEMEQGKDE